MQAWGTQRGLALLILTTASVTASAALTGSDTAVIDFNAMATGASSYAGKSNVANYDYVPGFTVGCSTSLVCYQEDGFLVGSPDEFANLGFGAASGHIHRGADTVSLTYHADSAGIYVRAADLSAFSLDSLAILEIGGDNGGVFNLVGFSQAYNPDIVPVPPAGLDPSVTPYANQVALQTLSSTGTILVDPAFSNISAFWIFYQGYPYTPSDGSNWDITIDNVRLSAVNSVPLPGAMWLFGSGLVALVAHRRRRAG